VEVAKSPSENLSDANVTQRLRGGIIMLMLGLILAAFFESREVSAWVRLWLFVPFFFAETAFFQAVHKTCGYSAFFGLRMTGKSGEKIADRSERNACLCRGKSQLMHSFAGASFLTALFVWIG
jgi:hypothetical protein